MAKNLSPSIKQDKQEYLTKIGSAKYSTSIRKRYGISSTSKANAGSRISDNNRPNNR